MKGSILDNKKEEFEDLFNQGLSDYKIARKLGINHCTVFQWRKKHNYIRPSLKEGKYIALSTIQEEVLLGTLLGDSSLVIGRDCVNPRFSCTHCLAQEEYCKSKEEIFKNLECVGSRDTSLHPDKRTGKVYHYYAIRMPANPAFLPYYKAFYKNGKKIIPLNLMQKFTARSLAYMFMDDGCKAECGYTIATNCFTKQEITEFRKFLFIKFNLETSMYESSNVLRIRAKSAKLFKSLILPYMHSTLLYKLHQSL
jgi:hypothetical protein